MRTIVAIALLSLSSAFADGARTQGAAPPAAYSVGTAFDSDRGRLVVFGGFAGRGYIGDTWEWDGAAWTRVDAVGPPARNSPAMVYDAARKVTVLFGGDARPAGSLRDTWTFDGKVWRQAATDGPPARTTHQTVYDSKRQRVVLFGGVDGSTMLGDTWEWDGTAWRKSPAVGPSARALFGLAYDAARGKTVLFGGTSVLAPDAPSHGDTWEYDGAAWKQVATTGPSARDHVSMDFDAASRRVILHGGGLSDLEKKETWAFDGTAWLRVAADGPPRRYARLAFDTRAKRLLLYGGFDREPSNSLWALSGARWEPVSR